MLSWPSGTENYTITTIATSSTTVGGSPDFIGGPAIDLLHGYVYFIRTNGSAATGMRVLERYSWATGQTQQLYGATASSFPAPYGATYPATFQLVINVNTQVLYWFVRDNLVRGRVMQLDVSGWTPGATVSPSLAVHIDETPPLGGATVMTDWFAMSIDCSGNLYFAFCAASLCSAHLLSRSKLYFCL